MQTKNKIIFLTIFVIIISLFFYVASIFIHELVHVYDFRNIEKTNETFCVLDDCHEGNWGHYGFDYNFGTEEELEEYYRISSNTEANAYSVQFIFLIIVIVVIFIKYNKKIGKLYNEKTE